MPRRLDRYVRETLERAARLEVAAPVGLPDPPQTILDAMDAAGLTGDSWAAWRTFWRTVFALPIAPEEMATVTRHAGRTARPTAPVREAWAIAGRRGGKSRVAAVAAAFLAIRRDYTQVLAPGERGVIPVIAADRKQAGQVLGYLKGIAGCEAFAPFVARVLKERVEFRTGVTVEVHSANWRTTRGYTAVGLVADEIAFWRSDEDGQNPESEILTALRPGMATIPDALLLVISTPYAARGELYAAYERSYGRDDPRVLVWNADTASMNPAVPAHVIAEAFEADPVAAASEYGQDGQVQFRRDVQSLFDAEAVRAVIDAGRYERPPTPGRAYVAFVDPSGGSSDSMTLAIAHAEGETAVLDSVREVRPPFSPDAVVREFAGTLTAFGVSRVRGDRYGGLWPRERFEVHGIAYETATQAKSDLYRELVPLVNAGRVALLDLPRLRAQLEGLERRTARSGKDTIDHAPGGHDDVANAAAGALVGAAGLVTTIADLLARAVTPDLSPWRLPCT